MPSLALICYNVMQFQILSMLYGNENKYIDNAIRPQWLADGNFVQHLKRAVPPKEFQVKIEADPRTN